MPSESQFLSLAILCYVQTRKMSLNENSLKYSKLSDLYSKANVNKSKSQIQKEVNSLWLKKKPSEQYNAKLVELQDKINISASQ